MLDSPTSILNKLEIQRQKLKGPNEVLNKLPLEFIRQNLVAKCSNWAEYTGHLVKCRNNTPIDLTEESTANFLIQNPMNSFEQKTLDQVFLPLETGENLVTTNEQPIYSTAEHKCSQCNCLIKGTYADLLSHKRVYHFDNLYDITHEKHYVAPPVQPPTPKKSRKTKKNSNNNNFLQ